MNPIGLVGILLGAVFLFTGIKSKRTGETNTGVTGVTRDKHPIIFWLTVCIQIILGAAIALGGLFMLFMPDTK